MRAQVDAEEIQKLLPTRKQILFSEIIGLILFVCGLVFIESTIPSISLFIAGAIGISRGGEQRRWLKKFSELIH